MKARAVARAARRAVRVEAPKLADPQPTAPREVRNYDPGTRISAERISACIDRIFGDAPRLGSESLQDAAA